VRVRAYAVNNDEATLISRRPDGWRPGQDAAGVVLRPAADGSGPDEDTHIACYLDEQSWAERISVPTHCPAELDDRVSFEQAAALPIAGLTALRALRVGGAILGRQVLVTGATGQTKGEDMSILAGLVADGRLTPHIGLALYWSQTPETFERMAARAFRGKAVLTVSA
jgi:hypothetical protein